MATTTPKIVLTKETVDVQDFAASAVKSGETVDALSMMATDFMPEEKTVQVNAEGGFFAANLTAAQVKSLESSSEVEAVVDDIMVYALQDDGLFGGDDGFGPVEPEAEDVEALEADPYPEWDPEGEPLMSSEDLALLSQREPDVMEEFETEQLLDSTAKTAADKLQGVAGLPRKELITLIKCIIKCVLEHKGSVEEVGTEDIAAVLGASGMASGDLVEAMADVILWSLRLIFAPYAWRFSTGSGVRVAVVDTGIDPRHPDLRVYGGISYVPGVTSWRDDNGHGTHVAGTIAGVWNGRGVVGVAPQARVYAVKVLNRQGSGRLSWILNGLMACYRAGMHVVNLSLGSGATTHDPRVYNRAYESVGRRLRSKGILAVAAAGNSNNFVGNPARCPSYMAVSAIDSRRRRAPFSCFGPQVEICAPGVGVTSTWPGGGYRSLSGTSMATPHVAGVAALMKARRPAWHGDTIRVHMWRTALDLGTPRRDWAFGYGQVNAYRAVL